VGKGGFFFFLGGGEGCTCRHAPVHPRTEASKYRNTGNAKGVNSDHSLLRACKNDIFKAGLWTPILVECRLGRYAWRFIAMSCKIDFRGILVSVVVSDIKCSRTCQIAAMNLLRTTYKSCICHQTAH